MTNKQILVMNTHDKETDTGIHMTDKQILVMNTHDKYTDTGDEYT